MQQRQGSRDDSRNNNNDNNDAQKHSAISGSNSARPKIVNHRMSLISDSLQQLLKLLHQDVEKAAKSNFASDLCDPVKQDVFKSILNALNNSIANRDSAELLDFYFTLHSVFKICKKSNSSSIKDDIKKFLLTREKILHQDSFNYCFAPKTLANQYCYRLAGLLFPDFNPGNVLLSHSLRQNRTEPWFDFITGENNLPDPKEWFITPEYRIHRYDGIVDQAISNLKARRHHLNTIWIGTDSAFLNDPLSPYDFNILRQRSKTLDDLITHTEFLDEQIGLNDTIYSRLNELRWALKRGDKTSKSFETNENAKPTPGLKIGTEEEAGDDAFFGIAKFAKWWSGLKYIPNGEKIKKSIEAINAKKDNYKFNTLGERLKYIVDPYDPEKFKNEKERMEYFEKRAQEDNNGNLCVELQGDMLDRVLDDKDARAKLEKINSTINPYRPDEAYDAIKTCIEKELESDPKIDTGKHFFKALIDCPGFLDVCCLLRNHDEDLDYYFLNNIKQIENRFDYLHVLTSGELGQILLELLSHHLYEDIRMLLKTCQENLKDNDLAAVLACKNNQKQGFLTILTTYLAAIKDPESNEAKQARLLTGYLLEQFADQFDEVDLRDALNMMTASGEISLANYLLQRRNDFLVAWPQQIPHPIFYAIRYYFEHEDQFMQTLLKFESTYQAKNDRGQTLLDLMNNNILYLLLSALQVMPICGVESMLYKFIEEEQFPLVEFVLKSRPKALSACLGKSSHPLLEAIIAKNNSYGLIEYILENYFEIFTHNQLKHAILRAANDAHFESILAFLSIMDRKDIFPEHLLATILQRLIDYDQLGVAVQIIYKRSDTLRSLEQVEEFIKTVQSKKQVSDYKELLKMLEKKYQELEHKVKESYEHMPLVVAALDDDYDAVCHLLSKADIQEKQLKEAVFKSADKAKINAVRAFLEFIDKKQYKEKLTPEMLAVVFKKLLDYEQFELAKKLKKKRPDALSKSGEEADLKKRLKAGLKKESVKLEENDNSAIFMLFKSKKKAEDKKLADIPNAFPS